MLGLGGVLGGCMLGSRGALERLKVGFVWSSNGPYVVYVEL